MQTQTMSPGGAAAAFFSWTVISLIAIGVIAVLVIAGIIYGRRLSHQRRRAEQAALERAIEAGVDLPPEADPIAVETKAEPVPKAPDPDIPVVAKPVPAPKPAPVPPPAAAVEPDLAGALSVTTIKGLGPKVAAILAERGITRVDQLAALTPDQASELDAQLGTFAGRMARDRWIDQATLLASGDTAAYEAEFGKLG